MVSNSTTESFFISSAALSFLKYEKLLAIGKKENLRESLDKTRFEFHVKRYNSFMILVEKLCMKLKRIRIEW